MKMMYKGYEIDKNNIYGGFKSKEEIDEFCKENAIKKFIKYNQMLHNYETDTMIMTMNSKCQEQAKILHDKFNLTYEEIEMLEVKALQ